MDLNALIALAAQRHACTEAEYPELVGKDAQQRLIFALRHSAIHFAKTAGKIAAASEAADHGGELNIEELRLNVPKALINALRLAELVGMKGEEIEESLEEKRIVGAPYAPL